MTEGLADTSVCISAELGQSIDRAALPDLLRVSVVTLAALQAGVLAATGAA